MFLIVPSFLTSFRRFDARRECNARKYSYLIPAEIIGIKNDSTSSEIDYHLANFDHILKTFEVFSSILDCFSSLNGCASWF